VHQLVCHLPGQSDAPESPDCYVYIMAFYAMQHLFFLSQFFGNMGP